MVLNSKVSGYALSLQSNKVVVVVEVVVVACLGPGGFGVWWRSDFVSLLCLTVRALRVASTLAVYPVWLITQAELESFCRGRWRFTYHKIPTAMGLLLLLSLILLTGPRVECSRLLIILRWCLTKTNRAPYIACNVTHSPLGREATINDCSKSS